MYRYDYRGTPTINQEFFRKSYELSQLPTELTRYPSFNSPPSQGGELRCLKATNRYRLLQLTPPRVGERSESPQSRSSFNSRLRVGANLYLISFSQISTCYNSRPVGGKQIDGLLQRINYVWCFNSRSREEANKRTYTIAATLLIVLQLPPPAWGANRNLCDCKNPRAGYNSRPP